jgi:hypothetical protein
MQWLMLLLRKVLLMGVVWLTASGVLLAGIPWTACVCLGATNKAQSTRTGPRQCCCGSGCCSHPGGCPFCGNRTETPAEENAADEAQVPSCAVKPLPCQKVLVHSELVATVVDKNPESATTTFGLRAELSTAVRVPELLRDARAIHHIFLLPPPTDLVTLLQHFLI